MSQQKLKSIIKCSLESCDKKTLRPIIESFRCSLCNQMFCLEHRNPEIHFCVVLEKKEQTRIHSVRLHEDKIQRILNKNSKAAEEAAKWKDNNNSITNPPNKNDLIYTSKYDERFSLSSALAPSPAPTSLKSFSSINRATSKAAIEKIKLRMKCVGDTNIPIYDRIHICIHLMDDVIRGDCLQPLPVSFSPTSGSEIALNAAGVFNSRESHPILLPSQRTQKKLQMATSTTKATPTSDLYVWLDKTRSIGNSIDFIIKQFKLGLVSGGTELPNLCLVRCIEASHSSTSCGTDNEQKLELLPYSDLIGSVVDDGDSNLFLYKKSSYIIKSLN